MTAPATPPSAAAPSILVVDDHRYVRDMVRTLFEREGYRVFEAGDGTEALALARSERPDCVLLDVRMPGLSGFDVLERLSEDPRTREIPVIMLTAAEESLEAMDRAMRSGAVDYLAKPISPARVAIRVRGAIERRRLFQEMQALHASFTNMLVHDLRSPITVINAYAELLGQGGAGDVSARQREFLAKIQDSCERMVRLISEVLDLSKLEAGTLRFEPAPLDVADVASTVVERLGAQADGRGIALTLRRPPEACMALADGVRVEQILTNLVANALKITRRGGSVEVEIAMREGEVELAVNDSGPGIAADDLPRLFERVGQPGGRGHLPGTGLALLITRHLVQAQGGRIWAESDADRGSRFVVRLPRAETP